MAPRRSSIIPLNHLSRKFPSDNLSNIHPSDSTDIVGYLVITVADTGPGLSTEQQTKMFREGVQFNPNELQAGQGSGLGLWISKEIVTLHAGTINVHSDGIGCGSTFRVSIPSVYREIAEERSSRSYVTKRRITPLPLISPSAPQSPSNKIGTDTKRERHVLVVDDAASNRKLVCRILKSKGFTCDEAENGLQCVEMTESNPSKYEMIILDYEMPIMDGPTAAQKIRARKDQILIIGVTGNVLPEDIEHFLKKGANIVLPKPVKIDELLERIRSFQIKQPAV
jgi:CheY-like chemotaxis protein